MKDVPHRVLVNPQLLARARGGSPDALEAEGSIVELLDPIVRRQVTMVQGLRPSDRDDALQDGRIAVLRVIRHHDPNGRVTVEQAAVRRTRDTILARYGRPHKEATGKEHTLEAVPDPLASAPFEVVDTRPSAAAVRRFVATLSPLQQAAVHAVHWEGRYQSEVARERCVSKAAVGQMLERVYAAGRLALAAHSPSLIA